MPQTPIIEAKDLTFGYDGKVALKEVSFSFYEGEAVCVIGPNGAGKSTLLKLIMRILTGARGHIYINGKSLYRYSQKKLARTICYVPQSAEGLFPYSAFEFVLMGRYPHLSPFTTIKNEDEEACEHAMAMTETQQFAERPVMSLSGGERQRVYIAAALAQGAKTLLLDEPTTFLDPKSQDEILKTLGKVNRDMGVTIVSVMHDINSAVLWSDKIMALKEGRVVFLDSPEILMEQGRLTEIFDKDFLFAPHPVTNEPMIVPDVKR